MKNIASAKNNCILMKNESVEKEALDFAYCRSRTHSDGHSCSFTFVEKLNDSGCLGLLGLLTVTLPITIKGGGVLSVNQSQRRGENFLITIVKD